MDPNLKRGYEAQVIRREGECWGWNGRVDECGYGCIGNGTRNRAHRLSWRLHRGEIAPGLDVMHLCHNPSCSNPEHLAVGTRKANMRTSFVAGRLQRRIPLDAMPQVFADRAAGWTLQRIAERFGCSKQAVRHMINAHPELRA